MKKFKKDDYKIPVFSWCAEIEDGAMEQVDNLARLPFAENHVAILSDCHSGYGVPIGCVAAFKNVVSPHAIGYDLGCGMCAVKTNIQEMPQDDLKKIFSEIRKVIPLGFKHHKEKQDESLMPDMSNISDVTYYGGYEAIVDRQYESALKQIGTLGGGK